MFVIKYSFIGKSYTNEIKETNFSTKFSAFSLSHINLVASFTFFSVIIHEDRGHLKSI